MYNTQTPLRPTAPPLPQEHPEVNNKDLERLKEVGQKFCSNMNPKFVRILQEEEGFLDVETSVKPAFYGSN